MSVKPEAVASRGRIWSTQEFLNSLGDAVTKKIIRDKSVRQGEIAAESDADGNVTISSGKGAGVILTEEEALLLTELLSHLTDWGYDI